MNADGIVQRLRHLLNAVEAFENRCGQDDLRLLAVAALQFAAEQQIEFLVCAAEFDVRRKSH